MTKKTLSKIFSVLLFLLIGIFLPACSCGGPTDNLNITLSSTAKQGDSLFFERSTNVNVNQFNITVDVDGLPKNYATDIGLYTSSPSVFVVSNFNQSANNKATATILAKNAGDAELTVRVEDKLKTFKVTVLEPVRKLSVRRASDGTYFGGAILEGQAFFFNHNNIEFNKELIPSSNTLQYISGAVMPNLANQGVRFELTQNYGNNVEINAETGRIVVWNRSAISGGVLPVKVISTKDATKFDIVNIKVFAAIKEENLTLNLNEKTSYNTATNTLTLFRNKTEQTDPGDLSNRIGLSASYTGGFGTTAGTYYIEYILNSQSSVEIIQDGSSATLYALPKIGETTLDIYIGINGYTDTLTKVKEINVRVIAAVEDIEVEVEGRIWEGEAIYIFNKYSGDRAGSEFVSKITPGDAATDKYVKYSFDRSIKDDLVITVDGRVLSGSDFKDTDYRTSFIVPSGKSVFFRYAGVETDGAVIILDTVAVEYALGVPIEFGDTLKQTNLIPAIGITNVEITPIFSASPNAGFSYYGNDYRIKRGTEEEPSWVILQFNVEPIGATRDALDFFVADLLGQDILELDTTFGDGGIDRANAKVKLIAKNVGEGLLKTNIASIAQKQWKFVVYNIPASNNDIKLYADKPYLNSSISEYYDENNSISRVAIAKNGILDLKLEVNPSDAALVLFNYTPNSGISIINNININNTLRLVANGLVNNLSFTITFRDFLNNSYNKTFIITVFEAVDINTIFVEKMEEGEVVGATQIERVVVKDSLGFDEYLKSKLTVSLNMGGNSSITEDMVDWSLSSYAFTEETSLTNRSGTTATLNFTKWSGGTGIKQLHLTFRITQYGRYYYKTLPIEVMRNNKTQSVKVLGIKDELYFEDPVLGETNKVIRASILPATADNQQIKWFSMNSSIASVASESLSGTDARLTINGIGRTTIYAYTADSQKTSNPIRLVYNSSTGANELIIDEGLVYDKFDILAVDGIGEFRYQISTIADLNKMRAQPIKNYELINDIYLTESWTPIPSFSGKLYGNGFTIRNLFIENAAITSNYGLFGTFGSNGYGYVENLNLEVGNITGSVTGSVSVGALAGVNNGTIKNVTINSIKGREIRLNITSGSASVGGIVGTNNGIIEEFSVTSLNLTVNAGFTASLIGGAVGENTGVIDGGIKRSYIIPKVNADAYSGYVGGAVGKNSEGVISNINVAKYNDSIIVGNNVGGVVGYSDGGIISNVQSNVAITTPGAIGSMVGGIVGIAKNTTVENAAYIAMQIGSINGNTAGYVGGIVGRVEENFNGTYLLVDSYNGGTISGYYAGGIIGGIAAGGIANITKTASNIRISGNNNFGSIGGFAGILLGNLYISDAYFDGDITLFDTEPAAFFVGSLGDEGVLNANNTYVKGTASQAINAVWGVGGGVISGGDGEGEPGVGEQGAGRPSSNTNVINTYALDTFILDLQETVALTSIQFTEFWNFETIFAGFDFVSTWVAESGLSPKLYDKLGGILRNQLAAFIDVSFVPNLSIETDNAQIVGGKSIVYIYDSESISKNKLESILRVQVRDSSGIEKPSAGYRFVSENEDIAYFDESGNLAILKSGEAVVKIVSLEIEDVVDYITIYLIRLPDGIKFVNQRNENVQLNSLGNVIIRKNTNIYVRPVLFESFEDEEGNSIETIKNFDYISVVNKSGLGAGTNWNFETGIFKSDTAGYYELEVDYVINLKAFDPSLTNIKIGEATQRVQAFEGATGASVSAVNLENGTSTITQKDSLEVVVTIKTDITDEVTDNIKVYRAGEEDKDLLNGDDKVFGITPIQVSSYDAARGEVVGVYQLFILEGEKSQNLYGDFIIGVYPKVETNASGVKATGSFKISKNTVEDIRIYNYSGGEINISDNGDILPNGTELANFEISPGRTGLMKINLYPYYSNISEVEIKSNGTSSSNNMIYFRQYVISGTETYDETTKEIFNEQTGNPLDKRTRDIFQFEQANQIGSSLNLNLSSKIENSIKSFDGWLYVSTDIDANAQMGDTVSVTVTTYYIDSNGVRQVGLSKTIVLTVMPVLEVTAKLAGTNQTESYIAINTTFKLDVSVARLPGVEITMEEDHRFIDIKKEGNIWTITHNTSYGKEGSDIDTDYDFSPIELKFTAKGVEKQGKFTFKPAIYTVDEIYFVKDYNPANTSSGTRISGDTEFGLLKPYNIAARVSISYDKSHSGIEKIAEEFRGTTEAQLNGIKDQIVNKDDLLYNRITAGSSNIEFFETASQQTKSKGITWNNIPDSNINETYQEYFTAYGVGTAYNINKEIYENSCLAIRPMKEGANSGLLIDALFEFKSTGELVYTTNDTSNVHIKRQAKIVLNVVYVSSEDMPIPIATSNDNQENVRQLASILTLREDPTSNADANYILMNDVVISDWPFFGSTGTGDNAFRYRANFASLDGNNKTITLLNSAFQSLTESYSSQDLNLGLFGEISSNTIIKNVRIGVVAETIEYDFEGDGRIEGGLNFRFKDNKEFIGSINLNFGLLAGVNNGVITNCEAVLVESVEIYGNNEKRIRRDIHGNMKFVPIAVNNGKKAGIVIAPKVTMSSTITAGSLVGVNGSYEDKQGFITNCKSEVGITVGKLASRTASSTVETVEIGGNFVVGGFVGINNYKISSSYFRFANVNNYSGTAISAATGGFAGSNNGYILYSYVEGAMSEKENLPSIPHSASQDVNPQDPSVVIPHGIFRADVNTVYSVGLASAGFVFSNNGVISNTYSNIVMKSSTARAGFVYINEVNGMIEYSFTLSNVEAPAVVDTEPGSPTFGQVIEAPQDIANLKSRPFIGLNATTGQGGSVNNLNTSGGITNSYFLDYIKGAGAGAAANESKFTGIEVASPISPKVIWFEQSEFFAGFAFNAVASEADYSIWTFSDTNVGENKFTKPNLVSANQVTLSERILASEKRNGETIEYHYGEQVNTPLLGGYLDIEDRGRVWNPILIHNAKRFNGIVEDEKTYVGLTSKTAAGKLVLDDEGNPVPVLDQDGEPIIRNGEPVYYYEVNKNNYRIICDITFEGDDIGVLTINENFTAVLDGNGMQISNISINAEESGIQDKIGLFRTIQGIPKEGNETFIESAVVKALTLEVAELEASDVDYVGALAGEAKEVSLFSVHVVPSILKMPVIKGKSFVGGLVGKLSGESKVFSVSSSVDIKSTRNVSETLLLEDNVITGSYAQNVGKPDETPITSYVGSIIGVADCSFGSKLVGNNDERLPHINSVYNNGNVRLTGEGFVGGIIGYVGKNTIVSDIEFTAGSGGQSINGTILSGSGYVGGVVGENRGSIYFASIVNTAQDAIDEIQAMHESNQIAKWIVGQEDLFGGNDGEAGPAIARKATGGLVGFNNRGTIKFSYSKVNINNTKSPVSGGIVGINYGGKFDQVYATGSVIAGSIMPSVIALAGGIIGKNIKGVTADPHSTYLNNVLALNNYNHLAYNLISESRKPNNNANFQIGGIFGEQELPDLKVLGSGSYYMNLVYPFENFGGSGEYEKIYAEGGDTTFFTGQNDTGNNPLREYARPISFLEPIGVDNFSELRLYNPSAGAGAASFENNIPTSFLWLIGKFATGGTFDKSSYNFRQKLFENFYIKEISNDSGEIIPSENWLSGDYAIKNYRYPKLYGYSTEIKEIIEIEDEDDFNRIGSVDFDDEGDTNGKVYLLMRSLLLTPNNYTPKEGFGGIIDGQGSTIQVLGRLPLFYSATNGSQFRNLTVINTDTNSADGTLLEKGLEGLIGTTEYNRDFKYYDSESTSQTHYSAIVHKAVGTTFNNVRATLRMNYDNGTSDKLTHIGGLYAEGIGDTTLNNVVNSTVYFDVVVGKNATFNNPDATAVQTRTNLSYIGAIAGYGGTMGQLTNNRTFVNVDVNSSAALYFGGWFGSVQFSKGVDINMPIDFEIREKTPKAFKDETQGTGSSNKLILHGNGGTINGVVIDNSEKAKETLQDVISGTTYSSSTGLTYTVNTDITLPVLYKPGKTFLGWFPTENEEPQVTEGTLKTDFELGKVAVTDFNSNSGEKVYYARWANKTYTTEGSSKVTCYGARNFEMIDEDTILSMQVNFKYNSGVKLSLNTNSSIATYVGGLFGRALVRDTSRFSSLNDASINLPMNVNKATYFGGLLGYAEGFNINNAVMNSSAIWGASSNYDGIRINKLNLFNDYRTNYVGSIVGYLTKGSVQNSENRLDLGKPADGVISLGGLVGFASVDVDIINSVNYGWQDTGETQYYITGKLSNNLVSSGYNFIDLFAETLPELGNITAIIQFENGQIINSSNVSYYGLSGDRHDIRVHFPSGTFASGVGKTFKAVVTVSVSNFNTYVDLNDVYYDTYSTAQTVYGAVTSAGGLVGENNGNLSIENSYNLERMNFGGSTSVGGLVGNSTNTIITNSFNMGSMSNSSATYKGGLIGYGSSITINTSFNQGDMVKGKNVGGLIGWNNSKDNYIKNSYSLGKISGEVTGGIIGHNNAVISLENVFFNGQASGSSYQGGIIGNSTAVPTLKSVYYPQDTTGGIDAVGNNATYGRDAAKKAAQMLAPLASAITDGSIYNGFNISRKQAVTDIAETEGTWVIYSGEFPIAAVGDISFALLNWRAIPEASNNEEIREAFRIYQEGGSSVLLDTSFRTPTYIFPQMLKSEGEFVDVGTGNKLLSDYYVLAAPLTTTSGFGSNAGKVFTGVLLGVDISDETRTARQVINEVSGQALFGTLSGVFANFEIPNVRRPIFNTITGAVVYGTVANVPNLTINMPNFGTFANISSGNNIIGSSLTKGSVTNTANYSGGFVGYHKEGSLTVINSRNEMNIKGSYNVTGMVGYAEGANNIVTFKGSSNSGNIVSTDSGAAGLLAWSENKVVVENSYNIGKIEGNYSGGLLENILSAEITSSFNLGEVRSPNRPGGLVSQTRGTATISNSYNMGNVVGWNYGDNSTSNSAGGFIGRAEAGVEIAASFNDGDVTSRASSGGFVGRSYNTITINKSYNSGKITSQEFAGYYNDVGGFVGHTSSNVIINSSYNLGDIIGGDDYTGGFVGYAEGSVSVNSSSYFAGTLIGGNVKGTVIGSNSSYTTNVYYDNNLFISSATNGLTTNNMVNSSGTGTTLQGIFLIANSSVGDIWNFSTGTATGGNLQYPSLKGIAAGTPDARDNNGNIMTLEHIKSGRTEPIAAGQKQLGAGYDGQHKGSKVKPHNINGANSEAALIKFSKMASGETIDGVVYGKYDGYLLVQTIDFKHATTNSIRAHKTIPEFRGRLQSTDAGDANKVEITNFFVNTSDVNGNAGLFGKIINASIYNLNFVSTTINGTYIISSQTQKSGLISGEATTSVVQGIQAEDLKVDISSKQGGMLDFSGYATSISDRGAIYEFSKTALDNPFGTGNAVNYNSYVVSQTEVVPDMEFVYTVYGAKEFDINIDDPDGDWKVGKTVYDDIYFGFADRRDINPYNDNPNAILNNFNSVRISQEESSSTLRPSIPVDNKLIQMKNISLSRDYEIRLWLDGSTFSGGVGTCKVYIKNGDIYINKQGQNTATAEPYADFEVNLNINKYFGVVMSNRHMSYARFTMNSSAMLYASGIVGVADKQSQFGNISYSNNEADVNGAAFSGNDYARYNDTKTEKNSSVSHYGTNDSNSTSSKDPQQLGFSTFPSSAAEIEKGSTGAWSTIADYLTISNNEDFEYFMNNAGSYNYYKDQTVYLTTDLNLQQRRLNVMEEFRGIFNGQGHTIYNFVGTGFINQNFGVVKNVRFAAANMFGKEGAEINAGIAAYNKYAGHIKDYLKEDAIKGGQIINCSFHGTLRSGSGGLVGFNDAEAEIIYSYAAAYNDSQMISDVLINLGKIYYYDGLVSMLDNAGVVNSGWEPILSAGEMKNDPYVSATGGGSFVEFTEKGFGYTGKMQQIILQPGTYKFETWGADGGNHSNEAVGGKGGYSVGIVNVKETTIYYIAIGGKGGISNSKGGWNGGGNSRSYGGSGGGATHIATETGTLNSLESKKEMVNLVAGGGGGSGYNYNYMTGGHGGGLTGGAGAAGSCTTGGQGGTQTGGGASGTGGDNGIAGIFGSAQHSAGNGGAGGGGWYGGGSGQGSGVDSAGGGGSGYIGGVKKGETYMFGETGFVENKDTSGNGYAYITKVAPDEEFEFEAQEFDFTGGVQKVELPAGRYQFETWGADGGDAANSTATSNAALGGKGGKGGYTVGTITLTTPTIFYVVVGGGGNQSIASNNGSGGNGGYGAGGGGGQAYGGSGASGGAGGGGLSGIFTSNSYLGNEVMIAGGGGGGGGAAANRGNMSTNWHDDGFKGGNGGGITAGSSGYFNISSLNNGATSVSWGVGGNSGSASGASAGGKLYGGGGGGASQHGQNGSSLTMAGGSASGANSSTSAGGGGGGGGGYYGGGGGGNRGVGGGGGSGYIGGMDEGKTIMFGTSGFKNKPTEGGNGYAKIEKLGDALVEVYETFSYTGGVQEITLQPGKYTMQTWGADGGNSSKGGIGGKGGYSVGTITVLEPTNYYIVVGGKGGTNGGGAGGGATNIGASSAISTSYIVAGGGGGAANAALASTNTTNGGAGGGLIGGAGGGNVGGGTQEKVGVSVAGSAAGAGGGNNGNAGNGSAGLGGYNGGGGTCTAGCGGGGGGWYGGGTGPWLAGGGGSGYIGGVNNGITVRFGEIGFEMNPDNQGNGFVIISGMAGGGGEIEEPFEPQDFSYTGDVQEITLKPGTYVLETWGGNGGDYTGSGTIPGGKGGYSIGTITLTKTTIVGVGVGGKGGDSLGTQYKGGAGGGSASDIRIGGTNLSNRVIVAGGGGGANYTNQSSQYASGSHGGGLSGNDGGSNAGDAKGGSQSGGGAGGVFAHSPFGSNGGIGSLGNGGDGGDGQNGTGGKGGTSGGPGGAGGTGNGSGGQGGSGGGGGYYGGGGGRGSASGNWGSGGGAGGSSYIGGVQNGNTYMYGTAGYIPSPSGNGNGYARISKVGMQVRYVRDWLNGSTSNGGNHWLEIEAIDKNGINRALNRGATGTSEVGSHSEYTNQGWNDDRYITDGSTDTANYTETWSSGLQALTVDLGAVYTIEQINVWHYNRDGRTYYGTKTEVSADGITWYTIFDSAVSGLYAETQEGRKTTLVNGGGITSKTVATFGYTGGVQQITLQPGTYKFDTWGANGGGNNPHEFASLNSLGGIGGYTSGVLTITAPQTLYIYVGGAGSYSDGNLSSGGWNGGGGNGGSASGSGGGATDIRVVGGAWNNATSLSNRILVAGGGGGSDNLGSIPSGRGTAYSADDGSGGNGGGLTGGNALIDGIFHAGTGGNQVGGYSGACCYGGFGMGATPLTIGETYEIHIVSSSKPIVDCNDISLQLVNVGNNLWVGRYTINATTKHLGVLSFFDLEFINTYAVNSVTIYRVT